MSSALRSAVLVLLFHPCRSAQLAPSVAVTSAGITNVVPHRSLRLFKGMTKIKVQSRQGSYRFFGGNHQAFESYAVETFRQFI